MRFKCETWLSESEAKIKKIKLLLNDDLPNFTLGKVAATC